MGGLDFEIEGKFELQTKPIFATNRIVIKTCKLRSLLTGRKYNEFNLIIIMYGLGGERSRLDLWTVLCKV